MENENNGTPYLRNGIPGALIAAGIGLIGLSFFGLGSSPNLRIAVMAVGAILCAWAVYILYQRLRRK